MPVTAASLAGAHSHGGLRGPQPSDRSGGLEALGRDETSFHNFEEAMAVNRIVKSVLARGALGWIEALTAAAVMSQSSGGADTRGARETETAGATAHS